MAKPVGKPVGGLVDSVLDAESLAPSSRVQYVKNLGTLARVMGKPIDALVDDADLVIETIKRRYACPMTQRTFVSAIKALFIYNEGLKETHERQLQRFADFQNELSASVNDRYMSAEPSDRERRNWVPWPDVLARERELAAAEYGSNDHLLLAMYTLIEPMRQDYGALRVLVDRQPPPAADAAATPRNYLVLDRSGSAGTLMLDTYKTAKRYGRYERSLPPQLLAVIKTSLLAHPRAYLFVDDSGRPYRNRNSFTQFSNRALKRLFGGKAVTVSMLRHSHISSIDFNGSTPGDLFQKSRHMAHSIAMQQLYRRKVMPAEPPPPPPPVVVKLVPAAAARRRNQGLVRAQNGERYVAM